MKELRMLDRGREIMDLEVLRGREGILSRLEAELLLREARDLLHHSGVVHEKDKVEECWQKCCGQISMQD